MSDDYRIEAGKRLKQAREYAGYETAADAARALKLHPQNVRDQEAGRRGIDGPQFTQYARDYGVNLEWLVSGQGEMTGADIVDIWSRIPEANRNAAREMLKALQKKDGSA